MSSPCETPDGDRLDHRLQRAILDRLGFPATPPANLEGLRAVYGAWCQRVPFDNFQKVIALKTGKPGLLPGIRAVEFFEAWLADGTGATCWPSANALQALLESLGFEARRVAAHMHDAGVFNHGTVIVRCEGHDWLADSSLHTEAPMPLRRAGFVQANAAFFAEIEYARRDRDTDGFILWVNAPVSPEYLACRIFPEPVEHAYFVERFEASRERSPFNSRPYIRRNRGEEMLVLVGSMRYVRSARSLSGKSLSRPEILQTLRDDFHLSEGISERWAAAGGLEATFEEYTGPSFPPAARRPPSRR